MNNKSLPSSPFQITSLSLFSMSKMSSHFNTNMSCGLKVDTKSPNWQRTLTKILKKIKGVNYSIDVEEGMAYITGRVDPEKLLKKLSKGGKHADICWVQTGNPNPMNHYPNPYLNNGYHHHQSVGYHPGYAMTNYYPQRHLDPLRGYGYDYGYGPRSYVYPSWG